jgi:hypothetical protein
VTSSGSLTPTGKVSFFDGATQLGAGTLAAGKALFTTATLAVGSHSITAAYGGDANNSASTSSPLTEVIDAASTTTNAASSLNPAVVGQSITFTAAVTSSGNLAPTGTVTFFDGTTQLGSGTIASGKAAFTVSKLAVGSHSITAAYGGDANNSASTSSTLTEVINAATTATTLTSSLNPATAGQSVTFTATITGSSSLTPTGKVTFLDGTMQVGSGTLVAGVATFSTSTLTVGSHSITAAYGGDANNSASTSSPLSEVIDIAALATSSTSIASSLNPATAGQSVTFTAMVIGSGPSTPTGTVTFFDGATQLGTGTLAAGAATFSTSALVVGSHSITAAYGGDTNNSPSTSIVLTEVIAAAASDFTITASPTSQTVLPGGAAQYTISIASVNGTFPGSVSLAVTGLPSGASGSFTPASVTPGSGSASSVLSVQTAVNVASAKTSHLPYATLAVFLLPFLARKRRKLARYALILVCALISFSTILGLSGCGGGFYGPSPQSFNLSVTATAASTQHTTTLTLVVK